MPPIISLRNIILGVGVLSALIAVLLFAKPDIITWKTKKPLPRGDVHLWGTLPESEMNAFLQNFNAIAKTYTVRYTYVSEASFDQKLLEALASGIGPDLIIARYQTILSQEKRIYPYVIPEKTFKDMYVDGASVLFSQEKGALALPVSVEPLVLFYNRSLFSKHAIVEPPATWDEVSRITPSLIAVKDGKFLETSIALGTPDVPYAKDIIMAIVGQLKQVPVVRMSVPGGTGYFEVLANEPAFEGSEIRPLSTTNSYFTQFGDSNQTTYSWNSSFGKADDAFVAEKLAMYIGYSGELSTLRARNPRADIAMTFLPQTKGYNTFVTGMRMYGVAMLISPKNPVAAQFAQAQLASSNFSPALAGIVGAPPALRAYSGTQGLDPVIARSMLVARGWHDSRERESSLHLSTMISDIINHRMGVNDASSVFVSRLRDLYAR